MAIRTRSKSPILLLAVLVLGACGAKPAEPATSPATLPSAPARLSAEELDQVFGRDLTAWKFAAQAGSAVKSVHVRVVEDGKQRSSMGMDSTPTGWPIATVVVVIEEIAGRPRYVRCAISDGHGNAGTHASECAFSRPLTASVSSTPAANSALVPGTIVLLAGTNSAPETDKPSSFDSATAPCRLELVVE